MIKAFTKDKTDSVMKLWLNNILEAHSFISGDYWHGLYEKFKTEYVLKNEGYILEDEDKLVAFTSILDEGDIVAIFVDVEQQNKGVGAELLSFLKTKYDNLHVSVYEKNTKAIQFFLNKDFEIQYKQVDVNTGEVEIYLQWRNNEL